jgi:hypothetical protein
LVFFPINYSFHLFTTKNNYIFETKQAPSFLIKALEKKLGFYTKNDLQWRAAAAAAAAAAA